MAYAPNAGQGFAATGRSDTAARADVEHESDRWAPNKPFWHPASALSYMPNFQTGMMYAISRFAVEMGDQLGRTRGSSAIDPDLDKAAGLPRRSQRGGSSPAAGGAGVLFIESEGPDERAG